MLISQEFINEIWYDDHPLSRVLLPISWLYVLIVKIRRILYQSGLLPVNRVDAPVIVVGNLTVGGTGKTPLVIWLAEYLKSKGYKPGIISRGYGGTASKKPQQVRADSNPQLVGDEPVLIAKRSQCPVAIGRKRTIAAEELINRLDCDIIISDDGLQHYSLYRDIQINVIDGQRRFGNSHCLPAGPLREPLSRLKEMDIVVGYGNASRHEHKMEYDTGDLVNLQNPEKRLPLTSLEGLSAHAIAGIGNPGRFFSCLRNHKIHIIKHVFPDHHYYTQNEITFDDDFPVVMTEKDAVKCNNICSGHHWFLPIDAKLPETFLHRLDILLKGILNGQETA